MNRNKDIAALLVFLALPFGAAAMGAGFTPDAWYASLNKPAWNPPNWVFAPVWITLYVMMGVAAWLVWRERGRKLVGTALALFIVQLALNAIWTPLFFGAHEIGLALMEIAVLEVFIVATAIAFWRVRAVAGAMLLPYIAWVGFATFLNLTLWRLNP